MFNAALHRFEGLINLLSKIGQVLGPDRLDDLLFLVRQRERLSQIAVRQRFFRCPEQSLAELITDHGRSKEPVQSTAGD